MGAAKELAGGNLKARAGLPYGGSELGHLARTFDDLAKTLEQRAVDAKVAETEIQKQHLRQSAIHEISTAMTSSLDVGNVLNALSEGVAPLFPSSCVSIRWLDEQSGRIEPIAQSPRTDPMGQLAGAESESGFPLEVFKLKSPLLISNAQNDPRASDPESLRAAGFVTYLGLPMIVKGEVLGVLSFYSTETIDLRIEETFLADLTHQAAIALYNSHLFEQTRNQAAELEKSNRIKDEFLGVISHELRTPLNIIMNCAEALNMGVFGDITPEHNKGTEKIRVQASHLLSLINSILEITKFESGGMAVNPEPINLNELVRELESDYAMASKEKNLAINWQIPADLPNLVTDRMKLRQVAINLVNNAIKFTDQGSVDISFRYVPGEPFIEFSVSDTGIGMAEEFLPHIFDKFNQIDSATTRDYSGAGLGLYRVKSFVGLMGGSVSVYSKLGEGTTFTVRLPISSSMGFLEEDRLTGTSSAAVVAPRASMEVEL